MIRSPQDFIRDLKSASDPPSDGGPTKLEIAENTWRDASFYVPNKDEIIIDWILNKLWKDRSKNRNENPLLDTRIWHLLQSVLNETKNKPKAWLAPLLTRVQVAPIVISLLELLNHCDSAACASIVEAVLPPLSVLWPIGIHKTSTETLLDCFGALLCLPNDVSRISSVQQIASLVIGSYRTSLANSSGKKKLFATFLHKYLVQWVHYVAHDVPDQLYQAGVETIFNAEVLRPSQGAEDENPLIDALSKASDDTSFLPVLPRLFESYIRNLRANRSGVFGSVTSDISSVLISEAGIRFFNECQPLLSQSSESSRSSRLSLLSLVETERLYISSNPKSVQTLGHNVELAVSELRQSSVSGVSFDVNMQCLCVLARIDHDLISPHLLEIYTILAFVPQPSSPSFAFLELILAYHVKARSVDGYIVDLISSTSEEKLATYPGTSVDLYQSCLSSAIAHPRHLQSVAKAVSAFLTPSQVPSLTQTILDTLKNLRRRVFSGTDVDEVDMTANCEVDCVSFAIVARMASALLPALPIRSVSKDSQWEVLTMLSEARNKLLSRSVSKALKEAQQNGFRSSWAAQVVASYALQVEYALDVSKGLSLPDHCDVHQLHKLVAVLDDTDVLPELVLEIFRSLFHSLTKTCEGGVPPTTIFDKFLVYWDKNRPKVSTWDGQTQYLTFGKTGRRKCALALLHLVTEQHLPTFEVFASDAQITRLIEAMMDTTIADPSSISIRQSTLRAADFWELSRFRVLFSAYIEDGLSSLTETDDDDFSESASLGHIVDVFHLVLFWPLEYFSKTMRLLLVRKAQLADLRISREGLTMERSLSLSFRPLTIVRTFLGRMISQNGLQDQHLSSALEFLRHLLTPTPATAGAGSSLPDDFCLATAQLSEIYLLEMFKTADDSSTNTISATLETLTKHILATPLTPFSSKISAEVFVRLVDGLISQFSAVTILSKEVQVVLRRLRDEFGGSVAQRVRSLLASLTDEIGRGVVLAVWRSILSLNKWLGEAATGLPRFGRDVALKLSLDEERRAQAGAGESYVTTFSILLEESSSSTTEDATHMQLVVAAYLAFSALLDHSARNLMDKRMVASCHDAQLPNYTSLLALVSRSLMVVQLPEDELVHLTHLAGVVLRDHPPHTLKVVQNFTSQCINIFSNRPIFASGPASLRTQLLNFLSETCAERPATLRSGDIPGIWSIISKFLSRSTIHNESTDSKTFHQIVTTVNSLIRFRRDLVVNTLPHLALVLDQLISTLRSCRPNLGPKQTLFVMNGMPLWVNSKQPLGALEAKALARLLEGLTTKTVVRNHGSKDSQKAEALAKSFSKHAAYVLKAYVDAMNDQLCVVTPEVRKELRPGLFALCSMVSEHNRDALMISALDGGGKVLLKALWKEYEKHKYVGGG